ncbi:MAG: biotin synthase [Cirrosporium novae-zelandiae]|nr:MAG: biotin synthase [Cirrosporium novae-zelandiae]
MSATIATPRFLFLQSLRLSQRCYPTSSLRSPARQWQTIGIRRSMSSVVEDLGSTTSTSQPPPPVVPAPIAGTSQANPTSAPRDMSEAEKREVLRKAVNATGPRNDWTKEEISAIYNTPLMELTFQSGTLHRRFHAPSEIQLCTLMNIKTGGCTEDCSYCSQSTRHNTGLQPTRVATVSSVLEAARTAKENGSTRFCMGAAWRDMRGRKTSLRNIKEMISGVRALNMEVCVTLGMVDASQAQELKEAGLTAYNHNVDTSREFYPEVITTRTYDERLQTLSHVRNAGLNVCTGGILGLGESSSDRISLLHTVSTLPTHPESFPVNALVPIKGTPLQSNKPIEFPEMLRTIATARILMPRTMVRIAAGRVGMSEEQQVLCFGAGANAVFTGERMLTTECNGWEEDKGMFARWGLVPMKSFEKTVVA